MKVFLLALVCLSCTTAAPASHRYEKQAFQLESLDAMIGRFEAEHGRCPGDGDSTWWQELRLAEPIMTEALAYWGESEGGALPLDLYGQPLRYVPPRTIRTVGANGVDNGGASDDWDSGRRPNDGHWLREDDPAARRRLALCIRTAAIVVLFAFGVMRSKRAAIMVSLVVCGAIFAWMMPVGFDRGAFRATTASISPEWIHVIGASGYLMIAAGIVFFLRELATIERKPM